LCLAASSLWQSLKALGSFWRRLPARLGPQQAVLALAHQLARRRYQTLRSGVLPATVSAAAYAAAPHEGAVAALQKKAQRLGLEVTARAAAAPPPS
jgi:hypothetical protein